MVAQIDKEGANIERVRQEMSENGLLPEEWGGETPMVAVRPCFSEHTLRGSLLRLQPPSRTECTRAAYLMPRACARPLYMVHTAMQHL